MKQQQFLEVLDRDDAERRWHEVIHPQPLESERVPIDEALGRILAEDIRSEVDVPGFDRSNMDGFAIRAEDRRWTGRPAWADRRGTAPVWAAWHNLREKQVQRRS